MQCSMWSHSNPHGEHSNPKLAPSMTITSEHSFTSLTHKKDDFTT
jgi:hypothetical protein